MDNLTIRTATRDDYTRILELESENYVENVPDDLRKHGFLSAKMSEAQLDEIARDLGVVVAYEGDTFHGFFCISRLEHWPPGSVVERLVEALTVNYQDQRVADPQNFCVFGPMCLAPTTRGKGVLQKLYEYAVAILDRRIPTGVGFISVQNPRSLGAMAKLDWQPMGQFTWGEREYHAMIRDIA
ncbi:MAG: hypothetical protein QOF22_313 [Bradyrhizobium sp.]|jgi:hypothetical protein|nr:hypothetical protein [Bradyrhizobium sp.]